MARKSDPTYRFHKATGQSFVRFRRADGTVEQRYLGKYGTEESYRAYQDFLTQFRAGTVQGTAEVVTAPTAGPTVAEIVDGYDGHALGYYRHPDGRPTTEINDIRLSLRPLVYLFGDIPAKDFGPKALKQVRDLMVHGYNHPKHGPQESLARKTLNQRVERIKRMFRWAVEEEHVPATTFTALSTVRGLALNRSEARETEPIEPVDWSAVEATLPHLNPVVRAMVLFQWYTGCRPGEVCAIRADEIDRTGELWIYRPRHHKTAYRGKTRAITVGKQGQAILAPFIDRRGFLFSPAHAVEIINAEKRQKRKTPVQPSQRNRKKANPIRKAGEQYGVQEYLKSVTRAAAKANVEHWHPNQLRHSFATRVRSALGLEAAQVALGHANANVTQVYAERDHALAARVAELVG